MQGKKQGLMTLTYFTVTRAYLKVFCFSENMFISLLKCYVKMKRMLSSRALSAEQCYQLFNLV